MTRARPSFIEPVPGTTTIPRSLANKEQQSQAAENNGELRFMAFLTGVEGGGMPRDVFRIVVYFVMPPWDPLRPKPQGKRGQPRWKYEPERL